ncbi:MAG: iron complex outerrane recepter protein, partial [Verrucomicrobiota bacterium]
MRRQHILKKLFFPVGSRKKTQRRAEVELPKNWLLMAGLFTFFVSHVNATSTNAIPSNLLEKSLKELLDMPISIIGRREPVARIPAAVSVVTQDDIHRSGAMSIPEALRLVPGLDVAQLDSSQWAVSARGFNDIYANKLLVLQDGRSLYTPLFSGVFWDTQGTLMEDIDRIEVVRGPGATLWGANAVNGVINIITKNAKDTQGFLLTGGGGTQYRGFAGFRFGDQIGTNAFFRIYGTYQDHDDTVLANGDDANNNWRMAR